MLSLMQSLEGFIPRLLPACWDHGFCIEGRGDAELPEVLLGGVRAFHWDFQRVEKFPLCSNLRSASGHVGCEHCIRRGSSQGVELADNQGASPSVAAYFHKQGEVETDWAGLSNNSIDGPHSEALMQPLQAAPGQGQARLSSSSSSFTSASSVMPRPRHHDEGRW